MEEFTIKKQYTTFQMICAMIGAVLYVISILDLYGVTDIYDQIARFFTKKIKRFHDSAKKLGSTYLPTNPEEQ